MVKRNEQQLRDIVVAAYPDYLRFCEQMGANRERKPCNEASSEAEELACIWAQATDVYRTWAEGDTESEDAVMEVIEAMTEVFSRVYVFLTTANRNSSVAVTRRSCLV